jgi:hypothetical protein
VSLRQQNDQNWHGRGDADCDIRRIKSGAPDGDNLRKKASTRQRQKNMVSADDGRIGGE